MNPVLGLLVFFKKPLQDFFCFLFLSLDFCLFHLPRCYLDSSRSESCVIFEVFVSLAQLKGTGGKTCWGGASGLGWGPFHIESDKQLKICAELAAALIFRSCSSCVLYAPTACHSAFLWVTPGSALWAVCLHFAWRSRKPLLGVASHRKEWFSEQHMPLSV